jgi:hypothetical protein
MAPTHACFSPGILPGAGFPGEHLFHEFSGAPAVIRTMLEQPHFICVDLFKGIVSRDFVVCFLVSFDRSDISTHQERVLLLLKVRFSIEFLDFRVWA